MALVLDKEHIPRHIAIIMDGNGRWAKEKRLARTEGHREGMKRVEEIVDAADALGVRYVTFFAFSTENWRRSKTETVMLMRFLDIFLQCNLKRLIKNNIRFLAIGRKEPIPEYAWKRLIATQAQTKENSGLTLILAFNYGSRQEIADAARKIAEEALAGRLVPGDINEENFGEFLYTKGIPDPDLLIRTSGEVRISNFLLWQLSYAELCFPKVYWPEFKRQNFEEAISEYQRRTRRFGAV